MRVPVYYGDKGTCRKQSRNDKFDNAEQIRFSPEARKFFRLMCTSL